MVGGPAGASKTYSFLKIVEALPGQTHMAIEVDDGFVRLLALEFPGIPAVVWGMKDGKWVPTYGDPQNATLLVYHCEGFTQVRAAQKEMEMLIASGKLAGNSWVCVDGLDLIYNSMRFELIEKGLPAKMARAKKAHEDPWEAALSIRTTGAPMMEGGDWDMVHSFLENFITYLAFRVPCHLYVTTSLATINENSPYEQDDVKDFYKALGVPLKFEGYKRAPKLFDTLLAFKHDPTGYYVAIWKDRGGIGRKWQQSGRHSPQMMYENTNFYINIGKQLFGWS